MPYKGLDALMAKIDDSVIREWADTLKAKPRTRLFALLRFWGWIGKHTFKDPQNGEDKVGYWKGEV